MLSLTCPKFKACIKCHIITPDDLTSAVLPQLALWFLLNALIQANPACLTYLPKELAPVPHPPLLNISKNFWHASL